MSSFPSGGPLAAPASSDRYYRSNQQSIAAPFTDGRGHYNQHDEPQAAAQLWEYQPQPAPAAEAAPVGPPQILKIESPSQLHAVAQAVIASFRNGRACVTVQAREAALISAVRTQLELAVSRGDLAPRELKAVSFTGIPAAPSSPAPGPRFVAPLLDPVAAREADAGGPASIDDAIARAPGRPVAAKPAAPAPPAAHRLNHIPPIDVDG